MGMLPRYLVSFAWADRGSGTMRYRVAKAWVPTPGVPTSTRVVLEGRVQVPTHTTEERQYLADVLRHIAQELADGGGT